MNRGEPKPFFLNFQNSDWNYSALQIKQPISMAYEIDYQFLVLWNWLEFLSLKDTLPSVLYSLYCQQSKNEIQALDFKCIDSGYHKQTKK